MLLALTHNDSVVRLESRHLTVSNAGLLCGTVPVNLLSRVILTGLSQISGAVLQAFLERHIPVIVVTSCGQYLGQWHYTPSGDCGRKQRQYLFRIKEDITPAQQLLNVKLYNQKRVLQRLSAVRKDGNSAGREIEKIQKLLFRQTTCSALLGIEGNAAKLYFSALAEYVPKWCNFTGRNRCPPQDPFNAVLSYCYTIMTGELENLIRLHLLDPGIGILHSNKYNTPALALDFLELFRAGYCDMLVMGLFTRHQLRQEHFYYTETEKERQCYLTDAGKKVFFKRWEQKRKSCITWEGHKISWQEVWNRQIMQWIGFLEQQKELNFFKMI